MEDFNILIVDDEVLIAEYLKDVLLTLDFTSVQLAHDCEEAFLVINRKTPDLILLDIRMNRELEGIEIAKTINDDYHIPFIFITAHSDKEIISKALETLPLGYLIKPFKKMEVFAALNIAMAAIKKKEAEFITFKDGYETVKLLLQDVLFVVSEGNYINIFSTTKKYFIRYSLKWFKENTQDKGFEQVHKSYVINLAKVDRVTSKSVMIGDLEIPTSRNKSIDLKSIT
jgi:two-component system response regulator LytT